MNGSRGFAPRAALSCGGPAGPGGVNPAPRLAAFALEAVDDLRVTAGTERRNHERLRLAARKQGGAVSSGQYAHFHGDRADGLRIATVDARLTIQHALAHDVAFELVQYGVDLVGVPLRGLAARESRGRLVFDLFDPGLTLQLLGDRIRLAEGGLRVQRNGIDEIRVIGGRLPGPARLASLRNDFLDGLDGNLHLLV